jgi:hypothetical protein
MTSPVFLITVCLAVTPLLAQSRPSSPAAAPKAAGDVVYEGELENYMAIGGESTGWRLRTRTPDGRRQYIEVLLTAQVAQGVRANTRVQVRGTIKTRHYVERGDVQVLEAKSVIEVARTPR